MSDLNVHNHYRTMTRQEVAGELRQLATELESQGLISYATGTVALPVRVEREFIIDHSDAGSRRIFEYRLRWPEPDD